MLKASLTKINSANLLMESRQKLEIDLSKFTNENTKAS